MTSVSLRTRTVARTALWGIVAAAALTACSGQSKGVSAVSAGTTTPPSVTASPSRSAPSSVPQATERSSSSTALKKSTSKSTKSSSPKTVSSDVSQLKSLGIDLKVGVLIDVADDGRDRYLEIGEGGVVDFTGTGKTDDTMMALKPAQVRTRTESTRNRVVIAPPFYNEDLGQGSCVADIARGVLHLATCKAGAANQIWHMIPAGDSGQFELRGAHTSIRVDKGRITTGGQGYTGLQTVRFAE